MLRRDLVLNKVAEAISSMQSSSTSTSVGASAKGLGTPTLKPAKQPKTFNSGHISDIQPLTKGFSNSVGAISTANSDASKRASRARQLVTRPDRRMLNKGISVGTITL